MAPCAVVATNASADDAARRAVVVESAGVDGVGLHGVEERLDEITVADLACSLPALSDPEGSQVCTEGMSRIFYAFRRTNAFPFR